jgi:hypothetical protein
MTGTKGLYASTLLLASLAGFSTGWSVRPAEVRVVVSFAEKKMMEYEQSYRLSPQDRAALLALLQDYEREMGSLSREFDRKYGDQVDALKDRYDARLGTLLTADKRR